MSHTAQELIETRSGDDECYVATVRSLAAGVATVHRPARFYIIRIERWFGPRWFHFSGKIVGALRICKDKLTVPPFVPNRVVAQRVFVGPHYVEEVQADPIHIDCTSSFALKRQLARVDKDAAFLWFGGGSAADQRGCAMVYLTRGQQEAGFYVGWTEDNEGWKATTLIEISAGEMASLLEAGSAPTQQPIVQAAAAADWRTNDEQVI